MSFKSFKTFSICFVLIFIAFQSEAQGTGDKLILKKSFGSYQIFQGNRKLTISEATNIMKANPEAYEHADKAKTNFTFAQVVGAAGGFMIGWPVGTSLGGGDPNWAMAGIGAGLVLISIPINMKFNKQIKEAIDIYNSDSSISGIFKNSEIYVGQTRFGAGITWAF